MQIVLVEPSRIGRKILTDLLQRQNYKVVSFGNGLEAFNYISHGGEIDVLLTSFELAGMSGMELCWQLGLSAPDHKQIYVIAMSSNREIDKVIEALDSGADDFIRKPPLAEELYAKLRAAHRFVTMQQQLRDMATCDSMTGLLNRRVFLERAQALIDNTITDTPVSAIMLDIDHFKSINDNYGHHAGDIAICMVADLLKDDRGIAGRLGGEEFAVVLPICTEFEAADFAEQLRKTIAAYTVEADGQSFKMTSSFGVSQWFNTADDTITQMLKRADKALYEAKTSGRNRVVLAEQDVCFLEA